MRTEDSGRLQSDAELVERVQHGDRDAYALLVRRYERLVRAAVRNVVRDRHVAEDIAQESFLAAYESLASLHQSAKFGPWLLAIARHQTARARRRIVPQTSLADLDVAQPGTNGKLTDASQQILELVERLPDHERILIGLRYFDGHSVQDVANITGRPVGTVTKQLSRAHRRLEQWLKQEVRR
ncbi:MAG: sigma-70 family RNA polymerase sigma factor [Pirellulales bacterium]